MTDIPLDATQMAHQRTEMGFGRTVMGLERTLMAWIRTSLSLISFGFTIYKFLEVMQGKGDSSITENAPRNLGLFLILLGMGTLLLAVIQFNKASKTLHEFSDRKTQASISLIAAIGVMLAGVFTLLNMFFGFGGF